MVRAGMTEKKRQQCMNNTSESQVIFAQILKMTGGEEYRYVFVCVRVYMCVLKGVITDFENGWR